MSVTSKPTGEGGFTLAELLVVMAIMTVIGAMTTSLVVSSLRSTKQTQSRVAASQDVQREVERVARDLRVADPIRVAAPNRTVLDLYREGRCVRRTYELAAGSLTVSSTTYPSWAACASYPTTGGAVSGQTLLRDVVNGAQPMFSYRGVSGSLPASFQPRQVAQVTLSLTHLAPGAAGSATLSTTVGVRNARY